MHDPMYHAAPHDRTACTTASGGYTCPPPPNRRMVAAGMRQCPSPTSHLTRQEGWGSAQGCWCITLRVRLAGEGNIQERQARFCTVAWCAHTGS